MVTGYFPLIMQLCLVFCLVVLKDGSVLNPRHHTWKYQKTIPIEWGFTADTDTNQAINLWNFHIGSCNTTLPATCAPHNNRLRVIRKLSCNRSCSSSSSSSSSRRGWSAPCGAVRKSQNQMSSVQNPYNIPLYWLVNRDPYIGLLQSQYNWVV